MIWTFESAASLRDDVGLRSILGFADGPGILQSLLRERISLGGLETHFGKVDG